MSVSGVGAYTSSIASLFSAAQRSASSSSATTAGASNEQPTPSGGSGVQTTDFTSMTRKELFDWMNSKIKNGEMSFDESTTFVSMTLSFPVDGAYTGLNDTEHLNFMKAVEKGMLGAQQRNDSELFDRLQNTLRIMDRYQGEISGVDIRA
ncbi:hypothetical protein NP284_29800 [Rhodopseudomonas pseudopalustris]|uniref:hypothetical protein n=1 Tax=Rhodopseudomonas pseudopalustris TaxID=1513892 RepID=UPI003F946CC1